MNIDITEPISRKRWLNALGAGDKDDYSLIARLDKAEKILFESAKPKAVYRVMNRKDVRVEGFSLQKHLEGCHKEDSFHESCSDGSYAWHRCG